MVKLKKFKSEEIGKLYNKCEKKYKPFEYAKDRFLIDLRKSNLKIRTQNNTFSKINYIFKHKTKKELVKISTKHKSVLNEIVVTTDHICMVYNKNNFFENLESKHLKVFDTVSIYDKTNDKEVIGVITKIEYLGFNDEYVYDLEVDGTHTFYGNNILIHNSIFINIEVITEKLRNKYNLSYKINEWEDKHKFELWEIMSNFSKDITKNVREKLQSECNCENTSMMNYELEYIADVGIFQAKKNYGVHKIINEGPALTSDVKYVGLEMRKATLPLAIKDTLEEVYNNTFALNWTENDFHAYINEVYNTFSRLSPQEIAHWKGYNTPKATTGFLQLEKGATGIAKACEYYNQLIKKLKIADKYEEITIGSKVRFIYILSDNMYAINCIAFHDNGWPEEFDEIFKVDYSTMFDKSVLSPLKNFIRAADYEMRKPGRELLFDIFDL